MSIKINGVDKESTILEAGDKIGTYHLAENKNLYEVQRSNNFMFYVPLDGENGAKLLEAITNNETNTNKIYGSASEVLMCSVTQASVPHFTQGVISVKRGNSTVKYAGTPEFGEGSIVLNDFIGAGTKDAIMAWQNLSYNVMTEKVGLSSDYKIDCNLIEYTPDYQKVRTWILKGCWVSGISEDPYNSESTSDKRNITATIQFDKAYIDTSEIE